MADLNPNTSTGSSYNPTDRLFDSLEVDPLYKLRLMNNKPLFFQSWNCIKTSIADYDERDLGEKNHEVFTLEEMQEEAMLYINPKNPHAYVRVSSRLNAMFLFNPGVYSDYPLIHRFLGPATYSITAEGIKDLRWYIRGKEYTEYDYWDLMCNLFSDSLLLTLSLDETRYWTEATELGLPFPSRLNMAIENLDDTEDDERTQLAAHPVWSINGEDYVSAEKFWNSWERKSNDTLKSLL